MTTPDVRSSALRVDERLPALVATAVLALAAVCRTENSSVTAWTIPVGVLLGLALPGYLLQTRLTAALRLGPAPLWALRVMLSMAGWAVVLGLAGFAGLRVSSAEPVIVGCGLCAVLAALPHRDADSRRTDVGVLVAGVLVTLVVAAALVGTRAALVVWSRPPAQGGGAAIALAGSAPAQGSAAPTLPVEVLNNGGSPLQAVLSAVDLAGSSQQTVTVAPRSSVVVNVSVTPSVCASGVLLQLLATTGDPLTQPLHVVGPTPGVCNGA